MATGPGRRASPQTPLPPRSIGWRRRLVLAQWALPGHEVGVQSRSNGRAGRRQVPALEEGRQRTCRRPCARQRRGGATVRMSSPGTDSGGPDRVMCGSRRRGKANPLSGSQTFEWATGGSRPAVGVTDLWPWCGHPPPHCEPPHAGSDGRVLPRPPRPRRSRLGRRRAGGGGTAAGPRSEPFPAPTNACPSVRGARHKRTTRSPFRFAPVIRAQPRPNRR